MALKRVLISDPIDQKCVQILQSNGIEVTALPKAPPSAQLIEMIKDFDGLIVRSGTKVTKEVIQAAKSLQVVGRAGTGVDNIDVTAATNAGVLVMNTPGGNTLSAAEHTCAMMAALSRDIPQSCASLKSGAWDRKSFMGNELNGKTLGLVGLGRVGREVSSRMQAFGMSVIGYDPIVPAEVARQNNIEFVSLDEVWARSDWISIHTPLLPSTKDMINDTVFSKCKKGVRIVNVARGGIIKDESLLRALNDGTVRGAALDVFRNEPPKEEVEWEIIKHPKVVATPHLGANTKEAQLRVAEEIAQQFVDMNQGKPLVGLINGLHLAQANMPNTKSWLELARKLGTIAGKLGKFTTGNSTVSIKIGGSDLKNLQTLLSIGSIVGINGNDPAINLITAESLISSAKVTVDSNATGDTLGIIVNDTEVVGTVEGNLLLLSSLNGSAFDAQTPSLNGNQIKVLNQKEIIGVAVSDLLEDRFVISTSNGWTVTSGENSSIKVGTLIQF